MDSSNRYFYWGALYALFVMLGVLLGAYWFFTRVPVNDFFSLSDDVVMSVSLLDVNEKQEQKKSLKDETMPSSEPQSEGHEDIDELFESVDSSGLTYSKKERLQEELQEPDREFLKKINTRTRIKAKEVKLDRKELDLDLKMPVFNQQNHASKQQKQLGTKNAYFAKLHDLLYSGWKPYGYGEQLAIIVVHIHSNGTFSYRVKQWSASPLFNQTLQSYLESLRHKSFPLPEDGKSVHVKVRFISKEEDV